VVGCSTLSRTDASLSFFVALSGTGRLGSNAKAMVYTLFGPVTKHSVITIIIAIASVGAAARFDARRAIGTVRATRVTPRDAMRLVTGFRAIAEQPISTISICKALDARFAGFVAD
jgi:hypothetical protein